MSYTVHGLLRGELCADRDEPLAGVVVRLYSVDRPADRPPPRILDLDEVASRKSRCLVEATTYPNGTFAATLPDDYDGREIEVHVSCSTVPGQKRPRDRTVQVHVLTMSPVWLGDPYWEVSFETSLPAAVWCRVREALGAWVICGRVVEQETGHSVAGATVRALDADIVQHDALGEATTDYEGRFRIDYTPEDFHRTPLSPLVNIELAGGPDLFFGVRSYPGTALLQERPRAGRRPGRRNAGPCACVELTVPGLAPQPAIVSTAWEDLRRAEIERFPNLIAHDGNVYFRPWQLLLGPEAFAVLKEELTVRYGAEPFPVDRQAPSRGRRSRSPADEHSHVPADRPLQRYLIRRDIDPNSMTKVVRTLRSRLGGRQHEPGFGVHVNHVLFSQPFYQGGPADAPTPGPEPLVWPGQPATTTEPGISVLDTGLPVGWTSWHNPLSAKVWQDANDWDDLDESPNDGKLDTCAGHGLFICGLIHRREATIPIDAGRVLGPAGDGSDQSIAVELAENPEPVINMSFSGYTQDDLAPPELALEIQKLVARGGVVVAAAGNNLGGGTTQPAWPAAIPAVIAVGAYDTTQPISPPNGPVRAFTSNHGPWVDAYAPGVAILSSYVRGWPASNGSLFRDFARWSGTSFAAPQMAAEVAVTARSPNMPTPAAAAVHLLGSDPGSLPISPWEGNSGRGAKLLPAGNWTS